MNSRYLACVNCICAMKLYSGRSGEVALLAFYASPTCQRGDTRSNDGENAIKKREVAWWQPTVMCQFIFADSYIPKCAAVNGCVKEFSGLVVPGGSLCYY